MSMESTDNNLDPRNVFPQVVEQENFISNLHDKPFPKSVQFLNQNQKLKKLTHV